jgi:transposase, IS30 family
MKVKRQARTVERVLVDVRSRNGRLRVRRLTRRERAEVLRRSLAGEDFRAIADAYGFCVGSIRRILARTGGFHLRLRPRSERNLSLPEREEISKGLAAGKSFREIARELGRAPSTISREVNAKGKRGQYRAWWADEVFVRQSVRPKLGKLALHPELQAEVVELLQNRWSPQQIAAILKAAHPSRPQMQVSHETIYRSLFIQSRGELRRELTRHLRTQRVRRYPQTRPEMGGTLGDILTISERPASVEDRAVPGHWEGDLLMGKDNRSAIATLVERKTRFVMLVRLGRNRTADEVRKALTQRILGLPEALRRTLTWDRGTEMAQHARFSVDTNVKVYFCDPHSPWQRGSNENTNGLLRQYFPKGTPLSGYTQEELDAVAAQLNGRPRMTLGWKNPAQAFTRAVAMTA